MSNEKFPGLTPEQPEVAVSQADLDRANDFITDVAPHLGKMFGTDLDISVGKGWATDMKTGQVTVDPSYFIGRGYKPDWAIHNTLHEIVAHLREVRTEPILTGRVMRFGQRGPAEAIFHNIFADTAGDKRIAAALPRIGEVGVELYREKLFVDDDYRNVTKIPRHMQFLYKIIRDEMIPGSDALVLPEVSEAINRLRNYEGQGDVIAYSTDPGRRRGQTLTPTDRFNIWTTIIYPEFQQLIVADRQNPASGSSGNAGENSQAGQLSSQFAEAYKDYHDNHHAEPLSHEQQAQNARDAAEKAAEQRRPANPTRNHNEKLKAETGYGLRDQAAYRQEMQANRAAIDAMRETYQMLIAERVAFKRGLSRRAHTEGEILDANRLAQTFIDIKAGIELPEAYKQYEKRAGQVEQIGNTDYFFVFDNSGSMAGEKAKAAAACAVITMEGLAAMQRDIEAAEREHGVELDLDIRSALYKFSGNVDCIKPLSHTLTDKQRLQAFRGINGNGGSTKDYLALEAVAAVATDTDRQRVLIVVADGDSDKPALQAQAIKKLRDQGVQVFFVGIGDQARVEPYAPYGRQIQQPAELPGVITELIQKSLELR